MTVSIYTTTDIDPLSFVKKNPVYIPIKNTIQNLTFSALHVTLTNPMHCYSTMEMNLKSHPTEISTPSTRLTQESIQMEICFHLELIPPFQQVIFHLLHIILLDLPDFRIRMGLPQVVSLQFLRPVNSLVVDPPWVVHLPVPATISTLRVIVPPLTLVKTGTRNPKEEKIPILWGIVDLRIPFFLARTLQWLHLTSKA